MRLRTFGEFTDEIKSLREWEDVFPRDVDRIMKAHAEQYGNYFAPDPLVEDYDPWPGAQWVLNKLERQALSDPCLYAAVRTLRRAVQKIGEGLLKYGRYTKADRISGNPQKDYETAVRLFVGRLKQADPPVNTAPFERSLLFVKTQPLKIANDRHRERIEAFCKRFLAGLRATSREGRPVQPGNMFIFHLVNNLTVYRRKKDGTAMRDKRGRFKLERRWDDAARVLIWVHYKRMTIPWLNSFVRRYARSSAESALDCLKKTIQRKYAHLGPPPDERLKEAPEETRFHPLGRTVFAFVEDDKGRSGFREVPL